VHLRRHLPILLVSLLPACDSGRGDFDKKWEGSGEEPVFPVRIAPPSRAHVESYVGTNQSLEADHRVVVRAEVEGTIVERIKDEGDAVGRDTNGDDPLLLARLDDRELHFELRQAQVTLKEKRGKVRELELGVEEAQEELELARVTVEETRANFDRADRGRRDGTTSQAEYDRARFAHRLAEKKLDTSKAALSRVQVALELGRVAVEQAQVAVEKTAFDKDKTMLRSTMPGVVTYCGIRIGQRVSKGDRIYEVVDPQSLVAFARVPVRDAARVAAGNPVVVESRTTGARSQGRVLRVAPTVDPDAGTVTLKIAVDPTPGLSPGLYVALKIVVAKRSDALVVPKRAVLHDEHRGSYVFATKDGRARRRPVTLGFERQELIEIVEGVGETDHVVVEGQNTLTDGAKIEILAE
jgi:HlyD family secretion protein